LSPAAALGAPTTGSAPTAADAARDFFEHDEHSVAARTTAKAAAAN
jgi:hypothetical protein